MIDPEEAAFKALLSAIISNCITQNLTSRTDIQTIVTQYSTRYPQLTVDLIEGRIIAAQLLEEDRHDDEGDAVDGLIGIGGRGGCSGSGVARATSNGRKKRSRQRQSSTTTAINNSNSTATSNNNINNNNSNNSTTHNNNTTDTADTTTTPRDKNGKKKYLCKHPSGCLKYAQKGGLCIAHGAKIICKVDGTFFYYGNYLYYLCLFVCLWTCIINIGFVYSNVVMCFFFRIVFVWKIQLGKSGRESVAFQSLRGIHFCE